MAISASDVMKLRAATGLGMMACKKALTEADGDMDLAIENLRKQGQTTAAKRAEKSAKEGIVSVLSDGNKTLLVEINSETDFVARNDDFVEFSKNIAEIILEANPSTLDEALKLKSDKIGGLTIEEKTLELVGKIGEKISLKRFKLEVVDPAKEVLESYIHGAGKIGVIVKLTCGSADAVKSDAVKALAKDIAMQVAAASPLAVTREDLPQDTIAKEREIYLEQVKTSGKPEKIWDKIVDGKMNKYYKQIVLPEQDFIKDTDLTVAKRVEQTAKEVGSDITITSFTRFELGSDS